MAESMTCHACDNVGLYNCDDGFYYCLRCGSQAEDIVETGVDEEDFMAGDARGAIYTEGHRRVINTVPLSQYSQTPYQQPSQQSQFWKNLTLNVESKTIKKEEQFDEEQEELKPSMPNDFGFAPNGFVPSSEDYFTQIRIRYVMGIQLMIQFQCEVLVEKFGANPLICGLAGSIWLRLVAISRVFDNNWAEEAITESEIQKQEEPKDHKPRAKYSAEPHNIHGQRAVIIWLRSLRKKIPICYSLAVSFLACHIARETILPTDIFKWSIEGKLPYLAVFIDIEKCIGHPMSACPLSSSLMFRPSHAVAAHRLESLAASIAHSIGLELPPVNFYAIASRYLKHLSFPVEKILPHACRIYEWSMPPDLWLSTNEFRVPTRVCVMSILIVAIRILYDINGFGKWEESLSSSSGSSSSGDQIEKSDLAYKSQKKNDNAKERGEPARSSSHVHKSAMDATNLLGNLEAVYGKIHDTPEYSKDLPTYLKYCRDVVFAGLAPSFEDNEEEKIIEKLWDFFENQEDSKPLEEAVMGYGSGLNRKRSRDDQGCVNNLTTESKKPKDEGYSGRSSAGNGSLNVSNCANWSLDDHDCCPSHQEEQNSLSGDCVLSKNLKDRALRRMKSDMEKNLFTYISPRVNIKRFDYLHYVRKRGEGIQTYVAHADYYILLRACARLAQVDIRNMHAWVLKLERRLAWIENRINHCLHFRPLSFSCEFSNDVEPQ